VRRGELLAPAPEAYSRRRVVGPVVSHERMFAAGPDGALCVSHARRAALPWSAR
jgi:hypothetical protein